MSEQCLQDYFHKGQSFFQFLLEDFYGKSHTFRGKVFSGNDLKELQELANQSEHGLKISGANINGYRFTQKIYGLDVSSAVDKIREACLQDEYAPQFYVQGGWYHDAQRNGRHFGLLRPSSNKTPYLWAVKPWHSGECTYKIDGYNLVKVSEPAFGNIYGPNTHMLSEEEFLTFAEVVSSGKFYLY